MKPWVHIEAKLLSSEVFKSKSGQISETLEIEQYKLVCTICHTAIL